MKRNFNGKKVAMMSLFGFVAIVTLGFVVMVLWNNILVPVLHVTLINFWQALGLFLLSKLLFGGFGGRWGGSRRPGGPGWNKKEMYDKWEAMSPEERLQLREQWKNRCRSWKANPAEQAAKPTGAANQ